MRIVEYEHTVSLLRKGFNREEGKPEKVLPHCRRSRKNKGFVALLESGKEQGGYVNAYQLCCKSEDLPFVFVEMIFADGRKE